MQRNRQAARLLSITRDLAAAPHGLLPSELARRHSVTRRTVERDLAALEALGFNIETVPDDASPRLRKRLTGAQGLASAILSAPELAAARALADVAAGPVAASFGILLDKLEQGQPTAVRVDAAALAAAQALVTRAAPRPAAYAILLTTLQEAILACAELRITYRKGGGADARDYIARPCGLLFGGRNYLVWRGEDGAYRKFTLGHIEAAAPTGRHFDLADDFSMEDFAARSLGVMSEASLNVVLRAAPDRAALLRDFNFHSTQTQEATSDGGLLIRFRAAGVAEICNAIFGCGVPVTIVGPETLARAYRARLTAALENFE
ncbi:MAG: transcriptional regulator [Acidocella sp.]|nr:transcriptional regulator [Acidocella sp.]